MASYTTTPGQYVKFLRGTPTTWAKIQEQDRDKDTLYFISEKEATTGQLWLGNKLISGAGGVSAATTLNDLEDVLINEEIVDKSVLMYDEGTSQWKNATLLDLVQDILSTFKGATQEQNGKEGLVPAPQAGEQNLFLRGDATWANPVEEVEGRLTTVEGQVTTLVGSDVGMSAREIAQAEIEAQTGIAPETFQSLKDLANWFDEHPEIQDLSDIQTRLTELETVIGDMDLTQYDGATTVIEITNKLGVKVEAIEGDVNNIKLSLQWQDIDEIE